MDFSNLDLPQGDVAELIAQFNAAHPEVAAPVEVTPSTPAPTPPAAPAPAPAPEPAELPGKLRVPTGSDPVTVQALNIFTLRQQQGAPISLAESETLARQVLGLPSPAAPAPSPAAPEAPAPAAAPTSLDDQMAALTQEMAAAMDMMSADYDPNKVAALQTQMITLATQKAVEAVKASQTQDSEAVYRDEWTQNFTRATTLWPELSDPTSELHLLAGALQAKAQESENHPDYQRSLTGEAGYYFAEKAAKALGKVVSANPAAPAAPSPNAPASPAHQPPLAGIFGGGGITPPSAPNPGADILAATATFTDADWQALASGSMPV
jgi:hypothetical protein